ncbi:hypothetical protein [Streptomyces sp. SID3343]|uniref:hypothetical protein n=1 Tax=Streptomyces sp. SID3343 TaxID=2690260 RepID=UPI00136B0DD1|nr:hypothetical protein [Streptomyces sp. SID3343]MYW06078.1 hypothetical protein [Streptomyces sp. SID3343]
MSRIRKTAIIVVAFVGLGTAGVASAYAIPGRHPQVRKVCRVLDPEAKHTQHTKQSKHTKRPDHGKYTGAPAARKHGRDGVMGEVADHYCVPRGQHRVIPSGPPATR